MTGFRTPDESSGSPFARELLELGRSEQASAEVYEHAAQAGLRALSGTGAAAGATAGWFASGVAAKLGATVSLVALGAGLWWFAVAGRQGESSSRPRPAEPSKAALAGSARPADAGEANAGSTVPLSVSDLPMESREPSLRALDSVSPSARSQDELGREIALLDRAKALLVAGDAKGAVRALEGQQLQILGPEALALKVEALIVGGDAMRARRLATQFLERHPSSPLARRVEELRKSVTRPRADEPSNAGGYRQ